MATRNNRTVKPSIGYCFLHGTDAATITIVPLALEWNHAHYITSHFNFTDATTKVLVNRGGAGLYEISVSCGMEKATGNPTHGSLVLYINGVPQSGDTADCMIGAGSEHSDAFLHTTAYLEIGDYVEIYAHIDAGTAVVEDDTSRLHLKAIPMLGWNNKRGGRYPFGTEL